MPLTTYTAGEVLTAASLNDNFSFASSNGGLVCVQAETAFSAVADVTADGVFTSAYTNYRILLRYFCSTTGDVDMRFRVATVDTSANYNYQRITASSTTIATLNINGSGSAQIGQDTNGTFFSLSSSSSLSSLSSLSCFSSLVFPVFLEVVLRVGALIRAEHE